MYINVSGLNCVLSTQHTNKIRCIVNIHTISNSLTLVLDDLGYFKTLKSEKRYFYIPS
jgi:hypothetical protein